MEERVKARVNGGESQGALVQAALSSAIATAPQGASVPLHLEAHEADGSEEQTDEATDEAHSSLCLCIPADCGHSCHYIPA
jgi:hypothetical protein